MTARILKGAEFRDQIYSELRSEIDGLRAAGITPGLAAVLVGENPASQIYVRNKIAACEQLGIFSAQLAPPASITTEEMIAVVEGLNRRDDIDGILVQLPLPPQVDAKRVLETVSPEKDVDGFHPV
ncbi:MAG TPA: tetrahydrofolate dehydrogenase/cyclohydrolase catalytic domain-containing protein, partial [Candidatus Acidoferrales bacterium]|nr:tetrahydrofolate dehydrogenase/cyclohydrolase catalytic domain-containing protein [Candidatus Acidoferrales bacterium]